MTSTEEPHRPRRGLLVLAALGIVYGDIGTSPLYALREAFHGEFGMHPTPDNVLGVLSLILWSLILIISIKYLVIVLRADNDGEGGIIALMALVSRRFRKGGRAKFLIVSLGLFGASLLYGDGMITPAISVLSAVEGLEVATPFFRPYVLPITIGILIGLFSIQSRGTAGIGRWFGPVMLLWFGSLGALGLKGILGEPAILQAINPVHAIAFFAHHGFGGFVVLGAVFLVVTGGEALYADLGHFGLRPIRIGWFGLVLGGLMLNYLGQGALLLARPETASSPFYQLAPSWAIYPLVVLATMATVIASQAVISGAFSLTLQAVQLGFLPRMRIEHTSPTHFGQIYVPALNWLLLAATVGLVLGFRTSSALAAAYGVAVATDMVITDLLLYQAMVRVWKWPVVAAVAATLFFLGIDLCFFGANTLKIVQGGWFPLLVAAIFFTLMTTWRTGRQLLHRRIQEQLVPVQEFMQSSGLKGDLASGDEVEVDKHVVARRVPGTFVYLTGSPTGIPPAMAQNFRHNRILHEKVIFLTIETELEARVDESERIELKELGAGFYRIIGHYGFMEQPDVPELLQLARKQGLEVDLQTTTYVVGSETILATERPGMAIWREKLFALMARNAARATAFYRIPREQVLEIGTQVEI